MTTKIILIPVRGITNGRKKCELIENSEFKSIRAVKLFLAKERVKKYSVYSLTDFMDLCNNQEIVLDNYWLSYFKIKNDI